MSLTEETNSNSPLLSLPPELRNKIYHLCLIRSDTLDVTSLDRLTGRVLRRFAYPALLRTCSQIRHEASPVFYGGNRFLIKGGSRALKAGARWVDSLAPWVAPLIREVIVEPAVSYPIRFQPSFGPDYLEDAYDPTVTGHGAIHTAGFFQTLNRLEGCLRHDTNALLDAFERSHANCRLSIGAIRAVEGDHVPAEMDSLVGFYERITCVLIEKWARRFEQRMMIWRRTMRWREIHAKEKGTRHG